MPPMDAQGQGDIQTMDGAEEAPIEDAPMDGSEQGAPMDGEEGMPMDDGGAPSDGGDSTMDIINQLSDDDKEAVRSYAQSMLARDETKNGQTPEDNGGDEMPMMETVIFSKGQLRQIAENFGPTEDELNKKEDDKRRPAEKKAKKNASSKSPFNSPKFNN